MDALGWFYTTDDCIFGYEVKATGRSSPDNLTRGIIIQSKGFTRKGIGNIGTSVRRIRLFSPYFSGPNKIKYSW